MSVVECEYPLFRRKFFGGPLWATEQGLKPMDAGNVESATGHHLQRPNLKTLDLKALPRDDGPPSETQLRRQKYLFFEKQCSNVADNLFLAGDYVAKNREILQHSGITHVVNCVGFICKEYFKGELQYKTYYLQDTPAEDILCVMYDAFDFIDGALNAGGKVLVHCSQGVSRSATIVIGYLMWKYGETYDEVFAKVKSIRGVANPNIGFTCQLLQWQKRRQQAVPRTRLYRIAAHCQHAPTLLVAKSTIPPKQYPNNTYRELDPRGAFVIHSPEKVYVWVGRFCPEEYEEAAKYHARLMPKFENTASTWHNMPVIVERQGQESPEFARLMDPPMLDPDAARVNARRASITGDLMLTLNSVHGSSVLGSVDAMDLGEDDSAPTPCTAREVDSSSRPDPMCTPTAASTAMPVSPFSQQQGYFSTGGASIAVRGPSIAVSSRRGSTDGPVSGTVGSAMSSEPNTPMMATSSANGQQLSMPLSFHVHEAPAPDPTRWDIQEVDEYSSDYQLYYDAMRSAGGESPMGGFSLLQRQQTVNCVSSMTQSGVPTLHNAHLDGVNPATGRPDSPATAEGRQKKYRRSDSELNIALLDKNRRHWPSLHSSIDEEDMPPNLP
mmetsp:Transcript_7479/g.16214  ORF Transcript_7479/g.16214 Transcript_7479/m.16214 type:complete len:611 (+) Transcript_7479:177-2009(+)|eukprot:CAMPEP_0202899560 /NCGR_PEP_ID=MMETSP1392-20130828/7748_1 /ASSEMBLY_ACC=CAM_ASM_000868 /TAXON_ID=225041 /ORGANISM="Chlamydomonas chlamydogama, Strain SAG 11-48b" /LENGTH=610 /DNA_ID=CAMNT_0049585769 /DNA_START=159 /DNA_END=1991 /DNA_ORIENTATION=-